MAAEVQNGFRSSADRRATSSDDHNLNTRTNEKKSLPADEPAQQRSFLQRHSFIVTVVITTMLDGLGRTIVPQFRYHYFRSVHQGELSHFNFSRGGHCGGGNLDPEVQAIEDSITKDATRWGLYANYAGMIPLFIASVVLGMKSDQIGRRFIFLLSFVSSISYFTALAIIIRLDLHYGWILIAEFFSSCLGGEISVFFASYAIISDTHGKKKPADKLAKTEDGNTNSTSSPNKGNPTIQNGHKDLSEPEKVNGEVDNPVTDDETDIDMSRENTRTLKLVGLEVVRRLSSSIISFATGYVIEYAGFFYTSVIVVGGKVLLFIFTYSFVTETGQQKKSAGFRAPLRTIYKALKDPAKRTTLILCNLALFFMIFGLVDEFEILRTYQMSPPFCFGAVQLGWLASESRVKGIFSMPLMWLWRRLHLSEPTIAAVGMLSYSASALVLATLRYTWVFFATPMIGIPGSLASSMMKAITSRYIGRAALASTFALMLAGEEVFWFAGSIIASYLYQAYVSTVPTAPFYLASASFAIATILCTVLAIRQRWSPPPLLDTEKNVTTSKI